jgi:hypothetical protein
VECLGLFRRGGSVVRIRVASLVVYGSGGLFGSSRVGSGYQATFFLKLLREVGNRLDQVVHGVEVV